VVAALELRQRLQYNPALNPSLAGSVLRLSMGLHSGRVVVGGLGPAPQPPATAVGAPLHMATRLQQQAAPGTILLSAATYQLVHAEIRATPCGTLTLDGQSTPVSVYAVQELLRRHAGVAGRGSRAQSPFVGRERELGLLQVHLAEAMAGESQVVGLVGAPGMGKTRLLREFCRRIPGNQVRVYVGQCLSYGQSTPYLPVCDLVRQLCGLAEGAEMAEHATAVQQRLHDSGIAAAEDVALLLQLLDLPAAAEELAGMSPEARQVRTFVLLRHLVLDTAQRQPLVLVVENLHWSDPTSEAWLASLVDRLTRAVVLLVGTYRPGYQPTWGTHAAVMQIALPPLRAPESCSVVQSVLGEVSLSETRVQALVAQAGGNPFFLEELAWHAVEQGGRDAPEAVPETVHAVLAARIDRLPPEEKRLLQTAAVIGIDVPLPLLQAIADVPEATLNRGLAHLQGAEFLHETRLFPEPEYAFKHALTHEVAYSSLLQERRRVLHAQIVAALETLPSDWGDEQVDRLAHHALRGEVWDKALAYCRQAVEKAREQSAYREIVGYFEHALGALQHLPESRESREQAIDLRLLLSMPLMACGESGRGFSYLREAEALAQALVDQRRLGEVLVQMTRHFRMLGDYDNAIEFGQRGRAIAMAVRDFPLQVMANAYLGQVHHAVGEYRQAIDFLRQNVASLAGNLRYARFQGRTSPAVISYARLIWCLADLGAFAEGIPLGEEGIRIAEVFDTPYERVVAYNAAGYLWLRKGDLSKAIFILERGLHLCQEAHIHDLLPRNASALGASHALSERLAVALPLLEHGMEQAASTGNMGSHALWLASLGEAYLFAGRQADALALTERALALTRTHKERGSEAYTLQILGAVHAHCDPSDAEGAERHYRQALALADELGMRPLQAHCYLGLGSLYARMDQREQARTVLTTAIDLYRAMDMTFWLPQAEAALAQVA